MHFKPKSMRIFIGIFLPEEVQNSLLELISRETEVAGVRWQKASDWHVTLKFLGETRFEKLEDVKDNLSSLSQDYSPFSLNLKKVGFFPRLKGATVMWTGIAGDVEALQNLQIRIDDSMTALHFPKEKRIFKPHVTLARASNQVIPRGIAERFDKLLLNYESKKFTIRSFSLVESQVTPLGSHYEILNEFPLKIK
jgi:2'-5' RNA ligase